MLKNVNMPIYCVCRTCTEKNSSPLEPLGDKTNLIFSSYVLPIRNISKLYHPLSYLLRQSMLGMC